MEVVDEELDEAVRELIQLRQRAREGWWQGVARQGRREARIHEAATHRALRELESTGTSVAEGPVRAARGGGP